MFHASQLNLSIPKSYKKPPIPYLNHFPDKNDLEDKIKKVPKPDK